MKTTTKAIPVEKYWDSETVVGTIVNPNGKSMIRTAITVRDNVTYIDLRKFVDKKGGTAGAFEQHTVHGISLPVTSANDLQAIIANLQKAGSKVFKGAKK